MFGDHMEWGYTSVKTAIKISTQSYNKQEAMKKQRNMRFNPRAFSV
jgi:hypothetical protein